MSTGLADRALAGALQASNLAMLLGCRVGLALYQRGGYAAGVERHAVRYGSAPHQIADVYRPRGSAANLPVVVYAHGGGFVSMDKDTHWTVAMPWADQGCMVVVPCYTLATRAPYPAALDDLCSATLWTLDHAAQFGGDATNLVLAGESAGGNLAAATAACCCYARPEPFAQRLFARGVVPKAVFAHAGTFQLTEWNTLYDNLPSWAPRWFGWPIVRVTDWYLGDPATRPNDLGLASPLHLYETQEPDRPLPFFRLSAGGRDPLWRETQRFADTLAARGADLRLRIYDDAGHISHLSVLTPHAKTFWADMQADQRACGVLPPGP